MKPTYLCYSAGEGHARRRNVRKSKPDKNGKRTNAVRVQNESMCISVCLDRIIFLFQRFGWDYLMGGVNLIPRSILSTLYIFGRKNEEDWGGRRREEPLARFATV